MLKPVFPVKPEAYVYADRSMGEWKADGKASMEGTQAKQQGF